MKLSPGTVMELMKISRPGEVEVVELGKEKKTKHIAFNGTPIILSLKLSHNQHRITMGETFPSSRKMAEC